MEKINRTPWITKKTSSFWALRNTFAALALALSTLTAQAADPIKTTIQSTTIVNGRDVSEKFSLELQQKTRIGDISGYIAQGKDVRISPEEFTSGGIDIANWNLSYGFRWLQLGGDAGGEAYGQIQHKFRLNSQKSVETWARVGLTLPEGVSISGGVSIPLNKKTTLSGLVSHKEDRSGTWPKWTLGVARITHQITPELSVYAGVDQWIGDDSSYPNSNTLDPTGPGFSLFALHGQGLTGNVGIKHTGKKWTTTHFEASHNEGDYWNFTGEVTKDIGKNTIISAGAIFDTSEEAKTTGYVVVKVKF